MAGKSSFTDEQRAELAEMLGDTVDRACALTHVALANERERLARIVEKFEPVGTDLSSAFAALGAAIRTGRLE